MIIGRRDAGNAQKRKKMLLFDANEEGPQGFSRLEGKRALADGVQFPGKALFNLCRFLP